MVAILRDPDEHARIADRCARKFGPAPPRKATQANEEQADDSADGATLAIIRMSGVVCIAGILALCWLAWLFSK